MKNYKTRVKEFWEWFASNEKQINNSISNNTPTEVTNFLGEQLNKVSDGMAFRMSQNGEAEINFSPSGNHALFFLTTFLVACAPEDLKKRWRFSPFKTRVEDFESAFFDINIFDKKISSNDVLINANYDEERNLFSVEYYNETLFSLDEDNCFNAFFVLLDNCIGENNIELFIGVIDKAKNESDCNMTLAKFDSFLEEKIKSNGRKMNENPCKQWCLYEMEPENKNELRFDITIGSTCFRSLSSDYYENETYYSDVLLENGAKAVFIAYSYKGEDASEAVAVRNKIIDRIADEVLGKEDSGQEIGILIGQAMGTGCAYMDFILFDYELFIRKVRTVLDDYKYLFFLSEFKQDSDLIELFEKNKK